MQAEPYIEQQSVALRVGQHITEVYRASDIIERRLCRLTKAGGNDLHFLGPDIDACKIALFPRIAQTDVVMVTDNADALDMIRWQTVLLG